MEGRTLPRLQPTCQGRPRLPLLQDLITLPGGRPRPLTGTLSGSSTTLSTYNSATLVVMLAGLSRSTSTTSVAEDAGISSSTSASSVTV